MYGTWKTMSPSPATLNAAVLVLLAPMLLALVQRSLRRRADAHTVRACLGVGGNRRDPIAWPSSANASSKSKRGRTNAEALTDEFCEPSVRTGAPLPSGSKVNTWNWLKSTLNSAPALAA